MSSVTIASGHKNLDLLPDDGSKDHKDRPRELGKRRKNVYLAYWDSDHIGFVWKADSYGVNQWCARVTVDFDHGDGNIPAPYINSPLTLTLSAGTPGRIMELLAQRYMAWINNSPDKKISRAETENGQEFDGESAEDED